MAFNPKPRPLCNLMHIVEMLNKAKSKLQNPTVRVAHGGKYFVLSCAASNSANPGYIYIKLNGEQGTYLGKIAPNGDFFVGYNLPMHKDTWLPQLEHINSDPVAACIAYGKESGYCSYCGRELTHPRSVHYGYGPICAANYGLPYEEVPAEIAAPLLVQSTFDYLDAILEAANETTKQPLVEQFDVPAIARHYEHALLHDGAFRLDEFGQGHADVRWTPEQLASNFMEFVYDRVKFMRGREGQDEIERELVHMLRLHPIKEQN